VIAIDDRTAGLTALIARVVPVLPLLIVTGFAVYGQTLFGVDAYSPVTWPLEQRIAVAVGVAIGIESVGNYVQWHAHDALLMRATSTAARLRRASYLIALGIAAINYSHFAGPGWRPTPAALVFAAFSASSPWLWGLHTRRAQRVQLTREGQIDASGATFSAERYRSYPIRTWKARRFSIDYSINDPREAWEGYREDRAKHPRPRRLAALVDALVDRLAATRPVDERTTQASSGGSGDGEAGLPDRRGRINTDSHTAICDDLQAEARRFGRPFTQDEVKAIWGIGSEKADRARRQLGWRPQAVDQADQAKVAVR
jgi:hypothetical protein